MAKADKTSGVRTSAFAGGVVGLVTFLAVGLLPSLVYGGYAGVALANALFGTPIHEHFLAQALVIFGMVVCLLSAAGLFVLLGASLSAGVFFGVESVTRQQEAAPAQVEASTSGK